MVATAGITLSDDLASLRPGLTSLYEGHLTGSSDLIRQGIASVRSAVHDMPRETLKEIELTIRAGRDTLTVLHDLVISDILSIAGNLLDIGVAEDGRIAATTTIRVPMASKSVQYGILPFEGIRAYRTDDGQLAIFRLKEHVDRMVDDSCGTYHLVDDVSREALRDDVTARIMRFCQENLVAGESIYIRPNIYVDSDKTLGLSISLTHISTTVIGSNMGKYGGSSKSTDNSDAWHVRIVDTKRPDPESMKPNAKISANYAAAILAGIELRLINSDLPSQERKFNEALQRDRDSEIAEGPGENVFYVRYVDNKIHLATPPTCDELGGKEGVGAVLPGITRDAVKKIARAVALHSGFDDLVLADPLTGEGDVELTRSDEMFFTGTAAEITAIGSVINEKGEEKIFGDGEPGRFTLRLKEAFNAITRGKCPDYLLREVPEIREWLTYVQPANASMCTG